MNPEKNFDTRRSYWIKKEQEEQATKLFEFIGACVLFAVVFAVVVGFVIPIAVILLWQFPCFIWYIATHGPPF